MTDKLTCRICGKTGMSRLTRHLTEVHFLTKEEYLSRFPDAVFEVRGDRVPTCGRCGSSVPDRSFRAANVLCSECRLSKPRNESTGVRCEVCRVFFRSLPIHLREVHELTPSEYLAQHPNSPLDFPEWRKKSTKTREKMGESAKKRWGESGQREAQSLRMRERAPWKGKRLSEEHRHAISKGGHVPHSLSEERKKVLGEQGRRVLARIRDRPEVLEKMRGATKRRHSEIVFGLRDPITRAKGLASRLTNGTLIPPGGGRGICGFRIGIPHYCRSTLEANFARVLIHFGIPYNYEPRLFRLSDGSHYTPDFWLLKPLEAFSIPEGWVELKGWRNKEGRPPSHAKIERFQKEVGHSVFVLAEHDALWKRISSEMAGKLPTWESPKRNLRTHPELFGSPAFSPIVSPA